MIERNHLITLKPSVFKNTQRIGNHERLRERRKKREETVREKWRGIGRDVRDK